MGQTGGRWEREQREKGKELARLFTDSVNDSEIAAGAFVEEMMYRHRTLQQGTMRLMLRLIWRWSEQDSMGHYDQRNEATVKVCAQIRDAVGFDGDMPVLPYV